jgi:proteasome lid subunit RPN8/RPN11
VSSAILKIHKQHWIEMRDHVADEAPLEACGLLAGTDRESLHVFLIANELASATRFRMDAKQQVAAFQQIERNGWDPIAIYHSHPAGPPTPSQTDLVEALYHGVAHLIWSFDSDWICRAFSLDGGIVQTLEYALVASNSVA